MSSKTRYHEYGFLNVITTVLGVLRLFFILIISKNKVGQEHENRRQVEELPHVSGDNIKQKHLYGVVHPVKPAIIE